MSSFRGSSTSGVVHRHPAGYDENTIMIKGIAQVRFLVNLGHIRPSHLLQLQLQVKTAVQQML
jgi:hypothetical protein